MDDATTATRTLHERINDGEFEVGPPCPPPPPIRPYRRTLAGDLTPEMFAEIQAWREGEADAKARYKAESEVYSLARREAIDRFWSALHTEHGIEVSDPFVATMDGLAYDRGHSNGFHEVASEFDDLMPLYRLYREAKGGQARGSDQG